MYDIVYTHELSSRIIIGINLIIKDFLYLHLLIKT